MSLVGWEGDPKTTVFIQSIKIGTKEVIVLGPYFFFSKGIFTEDVEVEALKYPIYKQILEMEALQLHTLETIRSKINGLILDRNTDAIRDARSSAINIDNYFWNDEHNPQILSRRSKAIEVLPHIQLNYDVFNSHWNMQKDYLGSAEDDATRIINSNQVLISVAVLVQVKYILSILLSQIWKNCQKLMKDLVPPTKVHDWFKATQFIHYSTNLIWTRNEW